MGKDSDENPHHRSIAKLRCQSASNTLFTASKNDGYEAATSGEDVALQKPLKSQSVQVVAHSSNYYARLAPEAQTPLARKSKAQAATGPMISLFGLFH